MRKRFDADAEFVRCEAPGCKRPVRAAADAPSAAVTASTTDVAADAATTPASEQAEDNTEAGG